MIRRLVQWQKQSEVGKANPTVTVFQVVAAAAYSHRPHFQACMALHSTGGNLIPYSTYREQNRAPRVCAVCLPSLRTVQHLCEVCVPLQLEPCACVFVHLQPPTTTDSLMRPLSAYSTVLTSDSHAAGRGTAGEACHTHPCIPLRPQRHAHVVGHLQTATTTNSLMRPLAACSTVITSDSHAAGPRTAGGACHTHPCIPLRPQRHPYVVGHLQPGTAQHPNARKPIVP